MPIGSWEVSPSQAGVSNCLHSQVVFDVCRCIACIPQRVVSEHGVEQTGKHVNTGSGLKYKPHPLALAQRAFGAARTGSVFAFAPFIGALLAIALGDRSLSWGTGVGGALMLAGVGLHLAESHGHVHEHAADEHEHAHRHDDGHHEHAHDPGHEAKPQGSHSHRHTHKPTRHVHSHVPDVHHTHRH